LVVVLVALISAFSVLSAQSSNRNGISVQQLIADGDALAERLFENEKALAKYQEALGLEPNNAELLWRISRCYVDIGEHLPTTTEEQQEAQLAAYERALEYADRAVRANPNSSTGYTRRAIAAGRVAMFRGVWGASDLANQMRDDVQKAIELNPQNAHAYYVLGRTHARVTERPWIFRWPLGLGWADMDEAVANYERAIALRPDFILYRLDCARAYFEEGEYEKAREQLRIIETLPTNDEDDDRYRREAKELLGKIREEEE
jgi:tetratricopeptide (TPR) repeat protein